MPQQPADIYVAVGSNIAPEKNIPAAVQRLRDCAESCTVSTFYRTRPLTRPEQDDYRNGVVWIRASLERDHVERDLLMLIEADLGRVRSGDKHAARPIDLDLAAYAGEGRATWIHPDVLARNFIATPLAALAPGLPLPNGMTAADNATALGRDGLVPDEALTQVLRKLQR